MACQSGLRSQNNAKTIDNKGERIGILRLQSQVLPEVHCS